MDIWTLERTPPPHHKHVRRELQMRIFGGYKIPRSKEGVLEEFSWDRF